MMRMGNLVQNHVSIEILHLEIGISHHGNQSDIAGGLFDTHDDNRVGPAAVIPLIRSGIRAQNGDIPIAAQIVSHLIVYGKICI